MTARSSSFTKARPGSVRHLELVADRALSDQQLLTLGKARAPRFAALAYDRFATDINRIVFKLLGPDAEHDDLVHDAFEVLLRNVHQVRDAERFGSWVLSVAINVVFCELRRRKRRRFWGASPPPAPELLDPGPDHDARELLRAVYAVLDQLPLAERQVFVLRHLDLRPMPQVAELSRTSLSSAKRVLGRAEQRFKAVAGRLHPELSELLWVEATT